MTAHADDQADIDAARARDALDAALDGFFGDGVAFEGEPVEGLGEQLVEEGYVERTKVGQAHHHQHVKPYREHMG